MMENENIVNQLDNYRNLLGDESLEMIDFDAMKSAIKEAGKRISELSPEHNELMILKEDYLNRIFGMLKANIICRKSDEDADTAVRLTEHGMAVPSGELISLYRKTAAVFRQNFSSTFSYLDFGQKPSRQETWRDYKI